jgi:hypothetical protein
LSVAQLGAPALAVGCATVLFVPLSQWWQTLQGFFVVQPVPEGSDLLLLGTFVATAGS